MMKCVSVFYADKYSYNNHHFKRSQDQPLSYVKYGYKNYKTHILVKIKEKSTI